MAYEVTVDVAGRTIIVTGSGTAVTADTLQLITEHQETFVLYPGFNFLYDALDLQITSSPAEMIEVANALFGSARFRRFAIVVPESRAHLARMFTALADPHGIEANVFTDRGDARRWLGLE